MTRAGTLQRWVGIPVALLIAVGLQAALFAQLPLFGAKPELVLLVAVAVALRLGPEWGAGAGFAAGLLQDLIGGMPLGMTSLSFTIVGYTVGFVAPNLPPGPLRQIGVAFVATVAGEVIVLALAWLLGEGGRGVTIPTVLLSAFYTAALAAVVVPLMGRLLTPPGDES